jgi:hypothetical protein
MQNPASLISKSAPLHAGRHNSYDDDYFIELANLFFEPEQKRRDDIGQAVDKNLEPAQPRLVGKNAGETAVEHHHKNKKQVDIAIAVAHYI